MTFTRPKHLGCAFMWQDGGDEIHQCAIRGEHDRHVCQEEFCTVTVEFNVGGGRWPVPHIGTKARKTLDWGD